MKKLSAFCVFLPAAFLFLGPACTTKASRLSQPQQEYLASLPKEKREALLQGSVKIGDTKRDV